MHTRTFESDNAIITGLPPSESHESCSIRKIRGSHHPSDCNDILKLAIRNAGVNLSQNGFIEKTPARSNETSSHKPSPRLFEIIPRLASESVLLVTDNKSYEGDKGLAEAVNKLSNSRANSFTSGISSLTSGSSTKSVIQVGRSGPLRGISIRMLEQGDPPTDIVDDKPDETGAGNYLFKRTPPSKESHNWGVPYLSSKLREIFHLPRGDVHRPRRHTDPPSYRSLSALLFGLKKSKICCSPSKDDLSLALESCKDEPLE